MPFLALYFRYWAFNEMNSAYLKRNSADSEFKSGHFFYDSVSDIVKDDMTNPVINIIRCKMPQNIFLTILV